MTVDMFLHDRSFSLSCYKELPSANSITAIGTSHMYMIMFGPYNIYVWPAFSNFQRSKILE